MTQCYHEERAQQPWIPAYAGMTQYYHGERAQQPWIPAYVGMTQCYHGEREGVGHAPPCPTYEAMARICNVKLDDLALQDAVVRVDQRFLRCKNHCYKVGCFSGQLL